MLNALARTGVSRAVLSMALLLGAAAAHAQSITSVLPVTNPGNSADELSLANPSYQRASEVDLTASTATSFTTRYYAVVSADSGLFGPARLEHLDSNYSVTFAVTAPGAYQLQVSGHRKGDLHLIDDNVLVGGHYADMTALSGSQSGGTITGGGLGLADPGRVDDIPLDFDPITMAFDQTSSATIFGVSNGAPVAHSLTFTWSQEAYSPPSGDEAAIRLGGTSEDTTETAADYPGNPARVQGDDGHFVTVTLVSLCGNGVIDSGPSYAEQCDQGALNGSPGSCCNADCTFRGAGATCRPAADVCDVAETCSGTSGTCPNDGFAPATVVCRASSAGEVCDEVELCTGSSPACPNDAVKPAGTTCRTASGVCDVPEVCDGTSKLCPSDAFQPDGTSCSDGVFCNGAETCESGSCTPGSHPCSGACDEQSNVCLSSGCPPQPLACRSAEKSMLLLKNNDQNTKDKLVWKWIRGQATTQAEFGNPTSTADYALCVYAGATPALVAEVDVPSSNTHWSPLGDIGYKYLDTSGAADGAQKIQLKGSAANKAKALVKGKGTELPDPLEAGALNLPVTVQLINQESGICWASEFASAIHNTSSQFKAKSP